MSTENQARHPARREIRGTPVFDGSACGTRQLGLKLGRAT